MGLRPRLDHRAASIGVRVSETKAEMRMVKLRVMANSRKRRPTMSPMKRSGMSTAMSEMVSAMMVKPICCAPLRAASIGVKPPRCSGRCSRSSRWRRRRRSRSRWSSAIRVRLLMLKPNMYMAAKVPTSDSGTATPAMKVAARVRRKTKITATTRQMVSMSSNSHVRGPTRGWCWSGRSAW
jgi:hypothetical protein